MFTLFHFAFELVKIAALSVAYSSFIYLSIRMVNRVRHTHYLAKISFKRFYLSIYGLLFILSFTYYGDHGLGDDANLPLGHFQTMESGDGYAYFTPKGTHGQIAVDSFIVNNDKLCMASRNGYFIYNLISDDLKTFHSGELYERYAANNHLPHITQFENFWPQYANYWNGWRFWVLP